MLRKPAVAGYFYQSSRDSLTNQVKRFIDIDVNIEKTKALGILAPHAGFIYSGAVAGALYSRIILPESIILIGPNHTGRGASVSVFSEGKWEMPNGIVEVDSELALSIIGKSEFAKEDTNAHTGEHSLEVQIPFIQFFTTDFKIVPITMMNTDLEVCKDLGLAIARTIQETGKDALIIASSDMTHYESSVSAKEKDQKAIDKIITLDPAGLHSTVRKNNITMCGFAPAVSMLYAAIELGASKANLVKYMNSGDVSGDYEQVVGYAGIIIS
ncbi:MAG: AmmeMemoRadiSam system protein B [Nitrospirae bacterium RIFCSPLOWO2_02_42_7]|nr:MAG: AmmeMemoRadiSam system protein B [Nitrospirae bacterium RIFCSPLOWO2_02_42_7]